MAIDTKKLRELAEKAGSGEWSATDGIVWFDDGDGAMQVMNPIPTFFAFDNMGAWPDAIESDDVAAYAAAACPKTVLALLAEIDALRAHNVALRLAGAPLSNIAFYLAQKPGEAIGPDECNTLDACKKDWDAALALRESGNDPR